MIATAFISDRADLYLPACRASVENHLDGLDGPSIVIDDREHKFGMAGAVRAAWEWALDVGADFLWHQEEDFLITAPVDLTSLAAILGWTPHLAQVVLKRQPWSPLEVSAGGIVELNPFDYTERSFGPLAEYTEHQRIFSLNPCLIPRWVLELGWPDGNEAEFTHRCLHRGLSFAFYGGRDDSPRCHHVGAVRGEGWRL